MGVSQNKRLVEQIMLVLDKISEEYFIHRPPLVKKTDSLGRGTGWGTGRAMTINFVFQTIKPSRDEIESRVKQIVDVMTEQL